MKLGLESQELAAPATASRTGFCERHAVALAPLKCCCGMGPAGWKRGQPSTSSADLPFWRGRAWICWFLMVIRTGMQATFI